MTEDVPVLIHIGPHKTGTTWIQNNLFPYAEQIVYDPDVSLSHRAFLTPRVDEFSVDYALAIFGQLIAKARSEDKILVISDEALGGRPFGQRFFQEVVAERLARTFPHAHILITTREQESIILSIYSEYVRYGFSSCLEKFLDQDANNQFHMPIIDLKYYEWDRFLNTYSRNFPIEQILALPMEWGLQQPNNYPSALEAFLGRPINLVEAPNVIDVQREALSGWALEVMRQFNKLHPQDSRHLNANPRFSPNSFGHHINRFTPDFFRKAQKRKMQSTVRDCIGSRFRKSNRRFQDQIDYSLEALGYRL